MKLYLALLLITLSLSNSAATLNEAREALAAKDYDAAEELFEELIEQPEKTAEQHFWFAHFSVKMTNQASIFTVASYASDALEHYQKALELEPSYIKARQGLIQFYTYAPGIAGGSYEKAYQEALRLQQDDALLGAVAYFDVAVSDEDEKQIAKAIAELLEHHGEEPRALVKIGSYHQLQERYAYAHEFLSRAIRLKPTADEQSERYIVSAKYQMAKTSALSGEHLNESIALMNNYLKLSDDYIREQNLPEREWGQYRLAQLLEKKGEYSLALKNTKSLLESDLEDDRLRRYAKQLHRSLQDEYDEQKEASE